MSRIYTIPAGLSFADALASGLLARYKDEPLKLAECTILLPTRRAARTLREAFLRQSAGAALLLPRLLPLGDVDADELALTTGLSVPPAIKPRRRQLLLAQLVARSTPEWPSAQHLLLAKALGQLLDDFSLEEIDSSKLDNLVEGELAQHWQMTTAFLRPVLTAWPAIVAAEGALDGPERRNRLLRAQAKAWLENPPQSPIIAAGSTGSIPATADLLRAVMQLPQGEIVLPGLPLADEVGDWWDKLDAPHPLYELHKLLGRLEVPLADVQRWPAGEDLRQSRRALLHTALLPAAATGAWEHLPALDASGLIRLDAAHEQEEASAVALKMRETLEVPGRTATLVTPDRALARRVGELLGRWGLMIDDSAGVPLAKTPPATFLRLILSYVQQPDAVNFLALMKHPLAALGCAPREARSRVREIEKQALRGPRRKPGLAALINRAPPHVDWLTELLTVLTPLHDLFAAPQMHLPALITALVQAAEALARTDTQPGADRLWRAEAGEALATWVADLMEAARDYPPFPAADAPELITTLLSDGTVRPRYGDHPRLTLLGPMEARLQQADVMILAGLNEGSWPAPPTPDPWLSRPMRRKLGLKAAEERLGQEAHDFMTLACAPVVMLTRSLRQGDTPAVAARWLRRLDMLLTATHNTQPMAEGTAWLQLTRQLDAVADITPAKPPAPCPPVASRPQRLSVTQVEKLRRDPYDVYAGKILRLIKLDDLDPVPGAGERGNFIHAVLHRFLQSTGDLSLKLLLQIGEEELEKQGLSDERAFWWPRFLRIAAWFIDTQALLTHELRATLAGTEIEGALALSEGFVLTAKADRIDRLPDGSLAVIDYKTGGVPGKPERTRGFSMQLPLEAAMAARGCFKGIDAARVSKLQFWQLSGGDPAGKREDFDEKADITTLADEALRQLEKLLAHFRKPDTAYPAQPHGDMPNRHSDYTHLARVKEWSGAGGEE